MPGVRRSNIFEFPMRSSISSASSRRASRAASEADEVDTQGAITTLGVAETEEEDVAVEGAAVGEEAEANNGPKETTSTWMAGVFGSKLIEPTIYSKKGARSVYGLA
jgi:hypothetical protein